MKIFKKSLFYNGKITKVKQKKMIPEQKNKLYSNNVQKICYERLVLHQKSIKQKLQENIPILLLFAALENSIISGQKCKMPPANCKQKINSPYIKIYKNGSR